MSIERAFTFEHMHAGYGTVVLSGDCLGDENDPGPDASARNKAVWDASQRTIVCTADYIAPGGYLRCGSVAASITRIRKIKQICSNTNFRSRANVPSDTAVETENQLQ